jgi:hypothetical protein
MKVHTDLHAGQNATFDEVNAAIFPRDSIVPSNEGKKYFLEILSEQNRMGEALEDYLESLT